jgi:hypothetical protein
VTLAVYDLLGKEVIDLESGILPAGLHTYNVNATGLPSGVYVYRLETSSFSESRRMVVIK